MIKKSMCCKKDMIYLGKNYHPNVITIMGEPTYIYICEKCGALEWSTYKDKCKYRWYKYDKERLEKLVKNYENRN